MHVTLVIPLREGGHDYPRSVDGGDWPILPVVGDAVRLNSPQTEDLGLDPVGLEALTVVRREFCRNVRGRYADAIVCRLYLDGVLTGPPKKTRKKNADATP